MKSLKVLRAIRRANVTWLMDQQGQTQLADKTGISPAYLYQMGKATGKQARGVSDENARLIEDKLRLPRGWMDEDHSSASSDRLVQEIGAARSRAAATSGWPFRFERDRWDALTDAQRKEIEKEVERLVRLCEAGHPAPRKKSGLRQHRAAG